MGLKHEETQKNLVGEPLPLAPAGLCLTGYPLVLAAATKFL